ncbi:MAG: hypothetical protein A2289_19710 [Deltaproteobacteria bacterium RIFOXYA12_FULL_58_15]|nr:MAG: hypothetical protein A2289_19710 [Deltaproteobacteria bacterium RIFOXYA12_FULL_58_15]OGR09283.1 MAG: hypothetical protein A2341_24360 [Deltaproteobacteria bacterium RIFOXYB12_FULL_58_9]
MLNKSSSLFAALVLGGAACGIKTNQIVIGQKTTLEKQLMGEAEPLSEEQMLVASVRSRGGGVHAGSADDLQSRAIAARRRQLYNRDDIGDLKVAGCLGEARGAILTIRPCDAPSEDLILLRKTLIDQENADRRAIIDWAIGIDPVLTVADRPQIVELYHRLILERAHPGDWYEGTDGTWAKK